MKDFDTARRQRAEADRDFTIGGEMFRVKVGVRPESLAEFDEITEQTTTTDTLRIIDGLILNMIEDNADESDVGGHARYKALREREEDPITVEDLIALAEWLVEGQTGRPTGRPGPSSIGPGRTGASSTDASSSPVSAAA